LILPVEFLPGKFLLSDALLSGGVEPPDSGVALSAP